MDKLKSEFTKLQNTGHKLNESKSKLFKTELESIGHKIDQNGIRPLQDKLLAIKALRKLEIEKELKLFLGAIQNLFKYIEISSNRHFETNTQERQFLELDGRTHKSIRKFEIRNHGYTVSGTLELNLPESSNDGRQYEKTERHAVANTTR